MLDMKTAEANRRENLELLIHEAGTLEAVARDVSSPQYLSSVRNSTPDPSTGRPREMGSKMARKLEDAFGKPRGWMDVEHPAPGTGSPVDYREVTGASVVALGESPSPGYAWPFEKLDLALVNGLSSVDLLRLEGAWLLAAAQLGFSLSKRRAA